MDPEHRSAEAPSAAAGDDRLDSWKEIGAYLKRDIRTLRRWEKDQGLPIHRHRHKALASVYAFKSELDRWWTGRAESGDPGEAPALTTVSRSRRWLISAGVAIATVVLVIAAWKWAGGWRPAADSLTLTQLTFNSAEAPLTLAVISPDGKYLAFKDPTGLGLQVLSSGQQTRIHLPPSIVFDELVWLNDSTSFVISGSLGIWRSSVFGEPPQRIADKGGLIAISPDGQYLAVTEPPHGSIRVHTINGEHVTYAVAADGTSRLSMATWSPNGRRVAYTRTWQSDTGVAMVLETRLRDGSDRTVLLSSGHLLSFVWAPDGRVLFSRPEPPPKVRFAQLWEVAVDEGTGQPRRDPRQITHTADLNFRRPTITADGGRMSFLVTRLRIDVYLAHFDPATHALGDLRRAVLRTTDNWPAAWAPGGEAVLFQSARNGVTGLYQQPLGSPDVQELVTREKGHIWQAVFSPDASAILYLSADQQARVMRRPADGGTPQALFELGPGPIINSWLKCARLPSTTCVVSTIADRTLRLVAFDATTGQRISLPDLPAPPAAEDWDLSADGSAVVSVATSPVRLIILDLRTRQVRNLTSESWQGLQSVAWLNDGWMITRATGDRGGEILYVDPSGNTTALWSSVSQRLWRPILSPDGRRIAFASAMSESTAWMLQGF